MYLNYMFVVLLAAHSAVKPTHKTEVAIMPDSAVIGRSTGPKQD